MNEPASRWWRLRIAIMFFAAAALTQYVMPDQPALALADCLGAAALATAGLLLFG